MPTSEMEPSRAAFLQSQVEVAEEEEEYAGKRCLSCHVVPPRVPREMKTLIKTGGAMRPDPAWG